MSDSGVAAPPQGALDVAHRFPALAREVRGHRLVYLDSASTSQLPQEVIGAMASMQSEGRGNVHRGVHTIAADATSAFEAARARVASFVGADSGTSIVFCGGATAALNIVARAWGGANVGAGDEVVITELEHHSNLVPWQQLCSRVGATLRCTPIDGRGALDLDAYSKLLGPRTRIVAFAHVSNALGTVNPIREMIGAARAVGAVTVVDGAQATGHVPLDVSALGCDFYAFSGHKMYAPSGIGVLYGSPDVLAQMPPDSGGGGAIEHVTIETTRFATPPHRFEPGTPNVAGAIGLAAAIDIIDEFGRSAIEAHESALLADLCAAVDGIEGARRIGTADRRAAVCSFVVDGVHPHDIATLLDERGIAVQASHHCAQPVMSRFEIPATVRASLGVYNTRADVDAFAVALEAAITVMRR